MSQKVFKVTNNDTRLGNFLHFGQLFKACVINYFAQIAHILGIFSQVSKSFILLVESFWATFIDIWQLFTGHTEDHKPGDWSLELRAAFLCIAWSTCRNLTEGSSGSRWSWENWQPEPCSGTGASRSGCLWAEDLNKPA